jgi:hypothetical protein
VTMLTQIDTDDIMWGRPKAALVTFRPQKFQTLRAFAGSLHSIRAGTERARHRRGGIGVCLRAVTHAGLRRSPNSASNSARPTVMVRASGRGRALPAATMAAIRLRSATQVGEGPRLVQAGERTGERAGIGQRPNSVPRRWAPYASHRVSALVESLGSFEPRRS